MKKDSPIIIWLLTGCFLVYMMVIIGGMTRLTHSGLSMVEWKPTGSLPPMNTEEWTVQFDKYKESPEYKLINYNFTLEDFKSIFWWEYIHRFLGRVIGVVFLIPFFYFLLKKKFPEGFLKKMLLLLCIGALQGFVGWFMVKSGLQKNPHVSHYRLATHLMTALTAFGFTFWFALDLIYADKKENRQPALRRMGIAFFLVVLIQIVYGAFVAGLKAGYLYPTYPKMGDYWIAPEVFSMDSFMQNIAENPAGVQFVHRCIALLLVLLFGYIYYRSRTLQLSTVQKKSVNWIAVIILCQFTLGVLTVLFGVPVFVAAAHQTGAFFLFASTLFLIHRVS